MKLQVAYDDVHIFLKVYFPDSTENRKHKLLEWNTDLKIYQTGKLREDSFVIKWSMEPTPVDISLASVSTYSADIWFWKAFRTDPVGYADDKFHIFSPQEIKKSRRIVLPDGHTMFLQRLADKGTSSYKSITYDGYKGDVMVRYAHRQPTGSRSDVKAKGLWNNGFWTIEFQRKLKTGNSDDVQFDPQFNYYFGLSRYEIAGKPVNMKLEQPYYESGDIGELLELVFKQ